MEIRKLIVDYEEDKQEIEKWLIVKGERKYLEFVKILQERNIEVSWKNISKYIDMTKDC